MPSHALILADICVVFDGLSGLLAAYENFANVYFEAMQLHAEEWLVQITHCICLLPNICITMFVDHGSATTEHISLDSSCDLSLFDLFGNCESQVPQQCLHSILDHQLWSQEYMALHIHFGIQ